MRENNGQIVALQDDGNIAQYEDYGEADDAASKHWLTDSFPVRIVDMDDD